MEDILALLPAPDADVRITNIHEGNHWGGSYFMNIGEFQVRERIQKAAIHEQLLGVLGDLVCSQVIQNLADQMYVEMDYDLRPTNRLISSWYGACVFMACHLMGKNISYSDVARVHGVSERSLREAYARVYPRRIDFIDCEITEIMGRENLERVLDALPALTWPPL